MNDFVSLLTLEPWSRFTAGLVAAMAVAESTVNEWSASAFMTPKDFADKVAQADRVLTL